MDKHGNYTDRRGRSLTVGARVRVAADYDYDGPPEGEGTVVSLPKAGTDWYGFPLVVSDTDSTRHHIPDTALICLGEPPGTFAAGLEKLVTFVKAYNTAKSEFLAMATAAVAEHFDQFADTNSTMVADRRFVVEVFTAPAGWSSLPGEHGTSGGVELTDELIESVAGEAEEGYAVEQLRARSRRDLYGPPRKLTPELVSELAAGGVLAVHVVCGRRHAEFEMVPASPISPAYLVSPAP